MPMRFTVHFRTDKVQSIRKKVGGPYWVYLHRWYGMRAAKLNEAPICSTVMHPMTAGTSRHIYSHDPSTGTNGHQQHEFTTNS